MQIVPEQIDPDAAKVVDRLRRYDHDAYLVGGCVRDLLLGRKPKDFDVVTSAEPPEIKKLFRNCRIIGRRFRLAHIFFGPKIIETSTFRANPRELEEEEGEDNETESGDLLIRRDNVFGTPEQDARRRDFTINGLFYDTKTKQVIDYVNGIADLEARVVRTIGDPDIRFREDPVRILRAVKFAARCDLTIEPETYRRMMEHRQEIAKCAQARVSEEFYRLLRAGAAKRSMELLVETELLDILAPEIARGLKSTSTDEAASLRRARLWGYLGALDRSTERRPVPPTNALLLATLMLAQLRDALDPDSTGVRDVGHLVAKAIGPALERLRPSRRDSEQARQILLAIRNVLPSRNTHRRRPRPGREYADEALRLGEIISDAEGADRSLAGRPIVAEGAPVEIELEVEAEAQLEIEAPPPPPQRPAFDDARRRGRRDERPPGHARTPGNGPAALPGPRSFGNDMNALSAAVRSLVPPPDRPSFLGTGAFGGPWSSRAE
jgi:poly(A) polymerase